jgi:NAD(P)-dependent dehydrogenase (short-subunit alcohol dehydrogenase family)
MRHGEAYIGGAEQMKKGTNECISRFKAQAAASVLLLPIMPSPLVQPIFTLPPAIPNKARAMRNCQPSPNIHWFAMDFLDPDSIANTGDAILAKAPHLDRIITTAGLLHDGDLQPEKRLGALTPEAMLKLYQINAMGPILFFKSLWPELRRAHPLVAASISARVGSISDNRLGGWYSYRCQQGRVEPIYAHPCHRACPL